MEKNPSKGEGSKVETLDEAGADAEEPQRTPTLQLRLEQPRDERRVLFHEGVVDNEHMNKKKSKCCCIYKKPLAFGESSSEDDEECEHCFGHPEKRKKNRKSKSHGQVHHHNHDQNESCPLPRHADSPSTSAGTQAEITHTSRPPGPAVPPQLPDQSSEIADSSGKTTPYPTNKQNK